MEKPDKTLIWKLSEEHGNFRQVAVISDLHMGNMWQQKTCLENFIKICRERSIDTLLNAGDTIDGMMSFPDHEKERFLHSAYSYEEYAEQFYPGGFKKNYIISGNHDKSLAKYEDEDYDFCEHLVKLRKDISYEKAGDDNVTKTIELPGNIRLLMYHGSNCINPAMGQKREPKLQQKTAELLSNNYNTNIMLFGHCHKRCLTNFMNTFVLGLGCFIDNTPFQVQRGTFGDVGGVILKYITEKGKITCLEPEIFKCKQLGDLKKRDF